MQNIPKLTAHRGYMEKYPENTWLGLKAALDAGACCLEFDIQMCADGKFILMHDPDLMRTSGSNGSVFRFTSAELTNISVHEPSRFKDIFNPLPVTLLDDALKELSNYPQARFMVELKDESIKYWGLSRVMNPLMEILAPYQDNAVLISFSYSAIEYAKNKCRLKVGWVLEQYDNESKSAAIALQPDYLICNYKKLPHKQQPWQGPWEWMLYEINSPTLALAWANLGVNHIETGDIRSMLQHQILAIESCKHGV